jgi:putative transposase
VLDREIPDDVKYVNVTVSRNPAGQYFASVLVEQEVQPKPKTNKTIAFDAGLSSFIKTNENEDVENPRFYRKNQAVLSRLQRQQSRKNGSKKGVEKSSRWLKLQRRINRLHNKIANQRSFFLHNISSWLVREYDVIYSETLNVAGMLRNHCLAKSIADASWSELFRQLAYKSQWYGKHYHQIGMFEPTTKTCTGCGKKDDSITLKDRVLVCPFCGHVEYRDLRAAKNIHAVGVKTASLTLSGAHE